MVRVPPDCPICCEPLEANLVATSRCGHIYHEACLKRWLSSYGGAPARRCPMCRSTCRATEVIGLQFELMQPSPNNGEMEQQSSVELQTRLSMARERMNTLIRADAERCREVHELQGRVMSLERELCSHREKATEAEAKASEFRARLVRAHVLRERLSTELQQLKQELLLHDTKKKYLARATSMSEERAVEFLQARSGEDLSSALRMQHSTICELRSENARLKSEKNEQRRQLREEIERKDAVIKRLESADRSAPESPQATATHPLQFLRRGVRASLSAEVTAVRQTRFGTDKPSASVKTGASTNLNTSTAGSKSASTPWRQMRRVVNALGTAVSRKKAGTNVPAISNKRTTPCTQSHLGFDSKHRASANSKPFAEGAALRRTQSSGLLARFASASAAPFLLRKAKKAAREGQKVPHKAQGGENSKSCSKSNDAAGQRPRNTEVQKAEATIPDASSLADFSARLMWLLLFVLLAAFLVSSLM